MYHLDISHGIAVFTDGSCWTKDRVGGWAWVAVDINGEQIEDNGHINDTTINQMELLAPTQALLTLYDRYGSCDVLIYSDSEYVVLGSNDTTRTRKANKQNWKDLDFAVKLHNITEFVHVRGHSNHQYNDLADKLAGQARKEGQIVYSTNTQS